MVIPKVSRLGRGRVEVGGEEHYRHRGTIERATE